MSRSKEDKTKALKWWNNLEVEDKVEATEKHYPGAKYGLSEAKIEIVWRRETQKSKKKYL